MIWVLMLYDLAKKILKIEDFTKTYNFLLTLGLPTKIALDQLNSFWEDM